MTKSPFLAASAKPEISRDVEAMFSEAVRHHHAGKLEEAERIYRKILAIQPCHAESLHLLGVLAYQAGHYDQSVDFIRSAIGLDATVAYYHSHLGLALNDQGRPDEAIACYRRALLLKPDLAEAHNNMGNALLGQDKLDEAVACYRQALVLRPDDAEIYANLGHALKDQGKLDEAIASCRQSLLLNPNDAETYNALGNALWRQEKFEAAEANYRRALLIAPDYVDALNNLASLLMVQGQCITALIAVRHSLRANGDLKTKRLFVDLVKQLHWTNDDPEIRTAMVCALSEAWDRPSKLARASADLVKLGPGTGECVARANHAWPQSLTSEALFGLAGPAALTGDRLLHALLISTQNTDIEMERFLTMARRLMLEAAGIASAYDEIDPALTFYSALARQCFINEYAFFCESDEIEEAGILRGSLVAALEAGTPVPALWILAVAAYFPLCSLPLAARLLDTQWPEPIAAVLAQQICEPEEEIRLRASIPLLTGVGDQVSKSIQQHYEENPYPRWVKIGFAESSKGIVAYLRQKFPLISLRRSGNGEIADLLVAGCGTGQHAIELAQQLQNVRVLAVDLSLSSLCYAKRKTQELGLVAIEYSQGDIMELDSAGRSFDIIESAGVLHHLADPFAGWQKLLSLLRPGGFMMIGLYSEMARRDITNARRVAAELDPSSTTGHIRLYRQYLMHPDTNANFKTILDWRDFYGISTCRDLLFHAQETQMTLGSIDKYLKDNNLTFLGFEIDGHVLHSYRQRFRADPSATDLGNWQIFENENPDTFSGMYQFWLQKAG